MEIKGYGISGSAVRPVGDDYPLRYATVTEAFDAMAQSCKGSEALRDDSRGMTYAELDRVSDVLASEIRKRVSRDKAFVGVALPRSIEAIVAFLGILKAGAAYVPLDPGIPISRLQWMVEDLDLDLNIAIPDSSPIHSKVAHYAVDIGNLERLASDPAGQFTRPDLTPEHPAYVLFTSGTTGRPKGVVVPHRAIVRLVIDADYMEFASDETLLHLAPNSFDAATWEIWGALLNGARLAIFTEARPSAGALGEFLKRHGVTCAWLTSGLFNAVIDSAPEVLRPIRQLLTGGEALSVKHVAEAYSNLPDTQIINGYGPTENTTFTCCYSIPHAGLEGLARIPIGRPINGTEVFILDNDQHPVEPGQTGELVAGGAGIALGYWKRPELNRAKFVRIPALSSGLLYRTGDYVMQREDGLLDFSGRRDDQVKVSGFRIELGEITHCLEDHPAVIQAIIMVRSPQATDKRLVAYYRTGDDQSVAETALRAWCQRRLPAHMVPQKLVVVEEFPLNDRGKVDTHALPDPFAGPASPAAPPANPTEALLLEIWRDVLRTGDVTTTTSFFDIGGHSLLAIILLARIQQQLGWKLSIGAFYEHPTIRQLARLESGKDLVSPPTSLPALKAEGLPDFAPLSLSQQPIWFLMRANPECRAYHVSCTFTLQGKIDFDALCRSLEWLYRRHPLLRAQLVERDGVPGLAFRDPNPLPLEIHNLTSISADAFLEHVDQEILKEIRQPINLYRDPLIRWVWWSNSSQTGVLLQVEHHIIHDGWSLNILLRELAEAYTSLAQGREPDLLPPTYLYTDYSNWQRRCADEGLLEIGYWKKALDGMPRFALPPDLSLSEVPI